ncbi:hypothetical protein B0H10DRAFT_2432153 [Mycena sp. CBHHK59/15]|nr:hypothetical protein B0H10DRAFT_2432153 [Mycena sp. CBHHK59/15]
MDDCDTSWCAVCDRQIVPKRTTVPVPPPQPSPDDLRRSKQGTIRQQTRGGGGLVRGTGRVRPNGTIKPAPAPPLKTRIEIDQSPAPLYCSDECRNKDIEFYHGRPAYSDSASSDTSDDSSSLTEDSSSAYDDYHPDPAPRKSTPNTRSLAILQREYGMDPLPPRTSETYDEFAPRVVPQPYRPPEFTSGVMMANRRLEAILPKPLKPGQRAPPLKPIPGWTDGSAAWRASTYSFAPPPQTRADILDPKRTAYESFVATPHRSAASGVVADRTTSAPASPTASSSSASRSPPSSVNSELLSSFEDNFTRRTSSRLSLFSPSSAPTSSTARSSPPRKQRPLANLAANGMLLVPDVLMRAPRSSESLTTLANARGARRYSASAAPPPAESFPGAARRIRSPLSGSSVVSTSDTEEDAEEAEYLRAHPGYLPPPCRPIVETRSWSYDNVRTYPVMAPPPQKEIRVVNGVEVEVEVPRTFKKLFTFAPVVR